MTVSVATSSGLTEGIRLCMTCHDMLNDMSSGGFAWILTGSYQRPRGTARGWGYEGVS